MTKRRKILGVGLLACLLIISVSILLVRHWAAGPNDGTIHIGRPTTPVTAPVSNEPVPLTTAYFISQLPHDFAIKRQADTPGQPVQLRLVATSKTQQFAVTIGTLPSTGVAGLADYNLRATQTADYTGYRPAGMPVAATGFRTTAEPAELTFFWPYGTRYAEISLSTDAGAPYAQLFTTFEQVSHNWQWK